MNYDSHLKGATAELKAQAWLLEQGYEVFRNVAQWGPADLVAFKEGKFSRIDVKCLQRNGDLDDWCFRHNRYLTDEQLVDGVKVLFVKDSEIGWNRDYFQPFKKAE